MKTNKTYYFIALTLFAIAIIGAVVNSIINYDLVALKLKSLGYPVYLISVIGTAQVLGLILMITKPNKWLVEWAYAGFFINFTFGIIAHLLAKDGNGATAVFVFIILLVTYFFEKKVRHDKKFQKKEVKLTLSK
ncbi:DoxX family protein [Cellulophaga tyrosinoxydans]|uniref:DoxX-like family protein n=1 Tax=Cellulophaga tyrosinoxydans TaxID=504486 RepID=A0A1W1ZTM8_9FLAO|nr:DoxX family protein [Cellulophaga tyrosinoxydans]SMC51819.1 DoxX-like family protein [Cellulophaga tyrosinoxydans]